MEDRAGEQVFDVVFTEQEVEDLLSNEAWQDDVAEAAFIGALYSNKIDKTPERTIEEIVRYNVVNKMREFFLSKSKPLPKTITWNKGYSYTKAFSFLENYICRVIMIKEANQLYKPITIAINLKDLELLEQMKAWCNDFSKLYPQIQISWKVDLTLKYKMYITVQ